MRIHSEQATGLPFVLINEANEEMKGKEISCWKLHLVNRVPNVLMTRQLRWFADKITLSKTKSVRWISLISERSETERKLRADNLQVTSRCLYRVVKWEELFSAPLVQEVKVLFVLPVDNVMWLTVGALLQLGWTWNSPGWFIRTKDEQLRQNISDSVTKVKGIGSLWR